MYTSTACFDNYILIIVNHLNYRSLFWSYNFDTVSILWKKLLEPLEIVYILLTENLLKKNK